MSDRARGWPVAKEGLPFCAAAAACWAGTAALGWTGLGTVFGAGTLFNRDDREYLVKGFPISIRFDSARQPDPLREGNRPQTRVDSLPSSGGAAGGSVHLACYFPMPFFRSARIELVGNREINLSGIRWSLRYHPLKDPPSHVAYCRP